MATRLCPCGAAFEPSARERFPRKWCSKVCADRQRNLNRALKRNLAPRPYTCAICGAAGAATGGGYHRKLCPVCSKRWGKVDRFRPMEQLACHHCGKSFTRLPTKGTKPKWCSACRPVRVRFPERAKFFERRRAALKAAGEKFSSIEIFERDGFKCGICGRDVDRSRAYPDPLSASLDHIVPLIAGGQHSRANTRCAHLFCNKSRGTRGAVEQLRLVG